MSGRPAIPYAGVFVDRQLQSLREAGVDVEYFDVGASLSPHILFRRLRELRHMIRRERPDLVHAQYGAGVGLVAVLSGAPAVVTFCGTDLHRGGGSMSLFRKVVGSVISNIAAIRARKIILVSEALRRFLWFRRRAASIVPRGIDVRVFSPGPRDDARSALGWQREVRVILFAGGRDPVNKGLRLAEEVVALVRESNPDVEMIVPQNVDADQMPVFYRAADVLLFTSLREGSPNVVKEAIACALPVVSVDVGDVAKQLEGVTHSTVAQRDARALATAVDDVLRSRQRSNGPERVAVISLERTAERIVEIYRTALNRHD